MSASDSVQSYDTQEPAAKRQFTERFDATYTRVAGLYDWAVQRLPLWRTWLDHALPYIQGPRVLEVSFGTGYLLTRYAGFYDTYGIDYNRRMVQTARRNLAQKRVEADLQQANVQALPYATGAFDSVVNTMAFSGYPDGRRAMTELHRVLRPGGRLILIDFCPPAGGNPLGKMIVRFWEAVGDIIREMVPLFDQVFGQSATAVTKEEIGGFGSVYLYVATKHL